MICGDVRSWNTTVSEFRTRTLWNTGKCTSSIRKVEDFMIRGRDYFCDSGKKCCSITTGLQRVMGYLRNAHADSSVCPRTQGQSNGSVYGACWRFQSISTRRRHDNGAPRCHTPLYTWIRLTIRIGDRARRRIDENVSRIHQRCRDVSCTLQQKMPAVALYVSREVLICASINQPFQKSNSTVPARAALSTTFNTSSWSGVTTNWEACFWRFQLFWDLRS